MIKELFENIVSSGIEDRASPILTRIRLLNLFLLAAAIVMNITLVYRIFNEPGLSLMLIILGTSLSFWGAFFWLRKTKNINAVSIFASLIIIAFMVSFIYINRNLSFGLVWSYMVPFFVVFVAGHKIGLPLIFVYYLLIYFPMFVKYDQWLAEGWDEQSLIRYTITSVALLVMAATSEYTFNKHKKELDLLVRVDEMTGLNNRRNMDYIIDRELQKINRYKYVSPISLCILDIDDFKSINDRFGHAVGDVVLHEMGRIIKSKIRVVDSAGRWGGEEFLIVFPSTSFQDAMASLERLRETIASHDFKFGGKVTCSFGLCSTTTLEFDKDRLLIEADKMLYEAKNNGKDRVYGIEL